MENLFEDGMTCNEWAEEVKLRCYWDSFERQERMLFMAGEVQDRPITKEECIQEAEKVVLDNIGWFVGALTMELVRHFKDDCDIDLDPYTAGEYNLYMGYEEGDEGYAKGVDVCSGQ